MCCALHAAHPNVGADVAALTGTPGPAFVVSDGLDSLVDAGAEVVVDFSRLDVARRSVAFCADAGIHTVVGTTGFTEEDLAVLDTVAPAKGDRYADMSPVNR